MDSSKFHFSFIAPTYSPSSSSSHVAGGHDDERDTQASANALRWQAFGVELNRVPPHGANPESNNNTNTRAGDASSSTSFGLARHTAHQHPLLSDVVTHPRHSADKSRPSTSAAPHPYVQTTAFTTKGSSASGHAGRTVPSYRALLAQDDDYLETMASSLHWMPGASSRPPTASHSTPGTNTTQRSQRPASAAWTASWKIPSSVYPQAATSRAARAASPQPTPSPTSPTPSAEEHVATAAPWSHQGQVAEPHGTEEKRTNPLLHNLHALSERVASATELQRCGPPRKGAPGGGGSGGGRNPFFKKGKKKRAEETPDDGDADASSRAGNTTDTSAAAKAAGDRDGPKKRRRDAQAAKPKTKTARTDAPQTLASLQPWQRGTEGGDRAPARPLRTLLPFYKNGPQVGADQVGLGGVGGTGAVPLVQDVPYECLPDAHVLFDEMRDALNNPDRIQAPPLFVGFSTTAETGFYSNFSLSSAWAGKVHGVPRVDPQAAHTCIDSIVLRWGDKVYVLPAHAGLPFLVRVLEELVGVELITFHAPALMLVLMAYRGGQPLVTHCVSDVRVMAWMATTAQQGGASSPQSTDTKPSGGRGGGVEAGFDVNTLFATHLNKHVLAPLPTSLDKSRGTRTGAPAATACDAFRHALANQVFYLNPLYRALYGQLGMRGLLQAFIRQEKGIAMLLATMKRNGMLLDMDAVRRFQHMCQVEMREWREKAEALVPGLMPGFNIQSADQCRRAMYEELQLGRYLVEPAACDATTATRAFSAATAPSLSVTKTGKLSTAEDTLRQLAQHHPFPLYLLRYRKAAKLLQTYVEGMMVSYAIPCEGSDADAGTASAARGRATEENNLFIDDMTGHQSCTALSMEPATEGDLAEEVASGDVSQRQLPSTPYARVHANFLQEGTDTGRLSCAEPNLQNLPRPTVRVKAVAGVELDLREKKNGGEEAAEEEEEEERAFRRCFVAPSGHVLVSVDYEQIELRVLAHLCADPALVNALTHSVDIHSAIAQQVFKKPTVTAEERSMAKRVVFGVLYGAGPRTLAAQMQVPVEDAVRVSGLLRGAFPHIDRYHQRVLQQARQDGFVRTLSGRVRDLPDLSSGVMGKRAYAERQAFNTVVQGTAADVMKLAMLCVEKHVLQVWPADVRLLSQIHDELVFSVAKAKLSDVVPVLVKSMTNAVTLLVPLRLAVKFGPTLGDLRLWTVEHDLGVGEL